MVSIFLVKFRARGETGKYIDEVQGIFICDAVGNGISGILQYLDVCHLKLALHNGSLSEECDDFGIDVYLICSWMY